MPTAETASSPSIPVSNGDLGSILSRMRAAARKAGAPDYDTRIEHLDKLERAILERKHELAKAVSMDYGNRSPPR